MLTITYFVSLVSTIILFVKAQSFEEGFPCILNNTGPGTCKLLSECEDALIGMRTGKMPLICSYQSHSVVVCCDTSKKYDNSVRVERSATVTTENYDESNDKCPPLDQRHVKVAKTGQKALDKCIEYVENVFPCEEVNGEHVRINMCTHASTPLIPASTSPSPNEFPHLVELGYQADDGTINWVEEGTLISDKYVMTSAHIMNWHSNKAIKFARLGIPEVSQSVMADMYSIIRYIKHPGFKRRSIYNDIALLELNRQVKFSERVIPACLHVGNNTEGSRYITVGRINTPEENIIPYKVVLEDLGVDECNSALSEIQIATDGWRNSTQLCAGVRNYREDTCQEVIFGNLQTYNKDVYCMYTVVGISSMQICNYPRGASYFTRVSEFVPWIESIVWP